VRLTGGAGEGRYAASMSPRNSMFNHGGVPKGNFTLYHAWIGRAAGGLGDTCIEF